MERTAILQALDQFGGNRTRAAEFLGISRPHLAAPAARMGRGQGPRVIALPQDGRFGRGLRDCRGSSEVFLVLNPRSSAFIRGFLHSAAEFRLKVLLIAGRRRIAADRRSLNGFTFGPTASSFSIAGNTSFHQRS